VSIFCSSSHDHLHLFCVTFRHRSSSVIQKHFCECINPLFDDVDRNADVRTDANVINRNAVLLASAVVGSAGQGARAKTITITIMNLISSKTLAKKSSALLLWPRLPSISMVPSAPTVGLAYKSDRAFPSPSSILSSIRNMNVQAYIFI